MFAAKFLDAGVVGRGPAVCRLRWMQARVDAVAHGKFGDATITATLFGGMDESFYADFNGTQRMVVQSRRVRASNVIGT